MWAERAIFWEEAESRADIFHFALQAGKPIRVAIDGAPDNPGILLIGEAAKPVNPEFKLTAGFGRLPKRLSQPGDDSRFYFSEELQSEMNGRNRNPSHIRFSRSQTLLQPIEHLPAFFRKGNCYECSHDCPPAHIDDLQLTIEHIHMVAIVDRLIIH
jgi:hypothetical protein